MLSQSGLVCQFFVLILVGATPMQFAATCDTCSLREGPIEGTRAEVIDYLRRMAWRIDESGQGTMACPDCAGPPSVFPTTRVGSADADAPGGPSNCTVCAAPIDACVACGVPFRPGEVVSCRREFGHVHARCSTQKFPKFVPPQ